MQVADINRISIDEYLEGEQSSNIRHEYYDGYVYAMAGASARHNLIAGNIFTLLRQKARGTDCRVFMADMKLYVQELNRFYYPDILLACDHEDDQDYYRERPCLIIEVLSPKTEGIDRREKLHTYQQIPSVQEYLLIDQEIQKVELYRRQAQQWQYSLLNQMDDVLVLECLPLQISMAEIYEDVFNQN